MLSRVHLARFKPRAITSCLPSSYCRLSTGPQVAAPRPAWRAKAVGTGLIVGTAGAAAGWWWVQNKPQTTITPSLAIEDEIQSKPLTPQEIDNVIQQGSFSVRLPGRPVRIDICQIGSNVPCEDRWLVKDLDKNGYMVGVLDGHIGGDCADYALEHLPRYIQDRISKVGSWFRKATPEAVSAALKTAFETLDQELLALPARLIPGFEAHTAASIAAMSESLRQELCNKIWPGFAGACAVVAYVRGSDVWIAHAGDCAAVRVSSQSDVPVFVTAEHSGKNKAEIERLKKEHPGEEDTVMIVRPNEEPSPGETEVQPRVIGCLQPTRTFGDGHSKWSVDWQEKLQPIFDLHPVGRRYSIFEHCKTPPYVTASPDVTYLPNNQKGSYVVLCCDGVTDYLKPAEITATIEKSQREPSSRDGGNLAASLARQAMGGSDERVGWSLGLDDENRRDWRDDITAIVLVFED
ncbi:[Pyruvate dehydrogenase [acetyl-transferring]]-phosphatase 1, mitochondrial [Gaertneriomyces sp. JEL0708]|nr:[Pyruvate dehydrogenase [acetyl-transferring]]-phosphatase 1, mitochondrial [Gaertneriomyces sp. JEL0708]